MMEYQTGTHVLTLKWAPEAASRASEWVRALCTARQLSEEDIHRVDLCTQELVQNILDHANPGKTPFEIILAARFPGGEAILEISDPGLPFDPRQTPPPPEVESLADMPVGGWGIHLVREYVDWWDYQRRGGRNLITLGFELNE